MLKASLSSRAFGLACILLVLGAPVLLSHVCRMVPGRHPLRSLFVQVALVSSTVWICTTVSVCSTHKLQ